MASERRDYGAAERLVFEIVALAPADASRRIAELSAGQDAHWTAYASGERLLWDVEFEPAAHAFAEALRHDPESPLARAALAFLLLDEPEGIATLTEIATVWPSLQRPHVFLGLLHLHAGDTRGALDALERATTSAPEDAAAWLQLSAALDDAKDPEGSAAAAERALSLDGGSFYLRRAAAEALYRAGRRIRAFEVAFGSIGGGAGVRSALSPLALPLEGGSRWLRWGVTLLTWLLAFAAFRDASFSEPHWWPLAVAIALLAYLTVATFASEEVRQWRRLRSFVTKREHLRKELLPQSDE